MSIYKTRSLYFKSLANKNKLVAHGRSVNGEERNSFHRMNDETELLSAAVNFAHFPCVVHCGFSGRYSGGANKTIAKRKHINELYFLSKVDNTASMSQIEDAYDQAFEVMEEFVSKMFYEFNTLGYCSNFDNLDLARFNFYPYQFAINLFGWALVFEDDKYAESIKTSDASKWYED